MNSFRELYLSDPKVDESDSTSKERPTMFLLAQNDNGTDI